MFSSDYKHTLKVRKANNYDAEHDDTFYFQSSETNNNENNITASFPGMITHHATHDRKRNNEEMNRHCIFPHNNNNFCDNNSLFKEVLTMEI